MANSTVIFEDTTWIDSAFYAADQARKDIGAPNIKLFLNGQFGRAHPYLRSFFQLC